VRNRIPSRHLEVCRGFGLEHAGERCGVVSGQVPVASSLSVWAEEGAERLGVESCLERACVHHQNTFVAFCTVVSAWSGRKARSKRQPRATLARGGQAGQDMGICFYLAAAAAAAALCC
jgi:hypothetical protein